MRPLLASVAVIGLMLQSAVPVLARSEPEAADWGVDPDTFSVTVQPGDDFYRYVNEGWLKTARPPEGVPQVDGFESGSSAKGTIWWNARTRQCLQMITSKGRAESIEDIEIHARCR